MYAFLADLVAIFHFFYVVFVVGGEILIILGGILGWLWVRRLPFRIIHLCSIAAVALEAIIGMLCPLTGWEYFLRELAGQRVEREISFIARLVRAVIFYDFPSWVFIVANISFAGLVTLTFFIVRPKRKEHLKGVI